MSDCVGPCSVTVMKPIVLDSRAAFVARQIFGSAKYLSFCEKVKCLSFSQHPIPKCFSAQRSLYKLKKKSLYSSFLCKGLYPYRIRARVYKPFPLVMHQAYKPWRAYKPLSTRSSTRRRYSTANLTSAGTSDSVTPRRRLLLCFSTICALRGYHVRRVALRTP